MESGLKYGNLGVSIPRSIDPLGIFKSMASVQAAWLKHPDKAAQYWQSWFSGLSDLQIYFLKRTMGIQSDPPVSHDSRFRDQSWAENPFFDFLKEAYLFNSECALDIVKNAPEQSVDKRTKNRAEFWMTQLVSAMSPSNCFWTNPQAIKRAVETNGESVITGWKQFAEDAKNQDIRMANLEAFEVGKTIAYTPGKVIHRTPLFELIQYSPQTDTVREVPIVIVPPWINRYYVMDMREKNSLINYIVGQGFTVFLISWKNIPKELADTTFEDYLVNGIDIGINIAREVSGSEKVHAVGYCIGGTALSTYMAWINRRPETKDNPPVASWTLFTALVDFSNPGDIESLLGEDIFETICEKMEQDGYMDGEKMNWTFRMLRPDMLIWQFWIQNYLLGEKPGSWDTLFWNSDPTRLPVEMHKFYLSEFYIKNNLIKRDAISIAGTKIDLKRINQPLYNVGTETDHIVLWKEAFKIADYSSAPVRQVVGSAGHILGIISPPVDPPKRGYWIGDSTGQSDADAWFEKVENKKVKGSWWPDWIKWLDKTCGKKVKPPKIGGGKYKAICNAPGTYVKEK